MIYDLQFSDYSSLCESFTFSMHDFINCDDIVYLLHSPSYVQYIPKVMIHIYVYVLRCLIM